MTHFLRLAPAAGHETWINAPFRLRFDQTGTYRIQVESRRVVCRAYRGLAPLIVTSIEAEFEIIAVDPDWAARTLGEALGAIDRIAAQLGSRVVSYQEMSAARDRLDHALQVLHFLDTADAARELARHLAFGHAWVRWQPLPGGVTPAGTMRAPATHDRTFELIAGLFGSPHRALIVSEMQRRLTSDPPVSHP